MILRKIAGLFALATLAAGCVGEVGDTSAPEEVGVQEEAMSRCGYPPRRPPGCTVRCECTEPVNGPFGEDIGDYDCFDGDCHLRPRPDCYWEMTCLPQTAGVYTSR
jgi:hypothetical protein